MIIKNRLNKASISLSQYCISVYDITQDIHLYYARLHKLINNYNTIESSDAIAKIINCNPAMLSPKSGVIRPQKIIRLAMSPILTERQIRKLSSQFKHLDYIIHNTSTTYGSTNKDEWTEKEITDELILEYVKWHRYMSKYLQLNLSRLYLALAKGAQQIVHLADLKTYTESRKDMFGYVKSQIMESRPAIISLSDTIGISDREIIPKFNTQFFQETILAYDSYMSNHMQYTTNMFPHAPLHMRLIAGSLTNDIIEGLQIIKMNPPKTIKGDKKETDKHTISLALMITYAQSMQGIPALQSSDRHFTITSKGEMSYTPANKPTYLNNNKDKWLSGADRMVTKFGKGVKKLYENYPYKIKDYIIEQVCNHLKAKHTFQGMFDIIEGKEITKWYDGENYDNTTNTATLGNSCMKHKQCQNMFSLYTNNPDNIKMLICTINDKLIGRAIIWYDKGKSLFMDRIYGNDKTISRFKTWAIDNGIMYKYKQSYEEKETFINTIGESTNLEFKVKLKIPKQCSLPYVDTMSYMTIKEKNEKTDTIILSNIKGTGAISLHNTGGRYSGYHVGMSRNRRAGEMYWNEEESMYEMDGELYSEDEVSYCEHSEAYYHADDCTWSETDNCCYHEDYIYWVGDDAFCIEREYDCHVYSEYHDEYLWMDDATSICDASGCHEDYVRNEQGVYLEHRAYAVHENSAFQCSALEDRDGAQGWEHIDHAVTIIVNNEFFTADAEGTREIEVSDDLSEEEISDYYGVEDIDWRYG